MKPAPLPMPRAPNMAYLSEPPTRRRPASSRQPVRGTREPTPLPPPVGGASRFFSLAPEQNRTDVRTWTIQHYARAQTRNRSDALESNAEPELSYRGEGGSKHYLSPDKSSY